MLSQRFDNYVSCWLVLLLSVSLLVSSTVTSMQTVQSTCSSKPLFSKSSSDHGTEHDHHYSDAISDNHHEHDSSQLEQQKYSSRCPTPSLDCACEACQHYFAIHFISLMSPTLSVATVQDSQLIHDSYINLHVSFASTPPTRPPITG